MSLPREPRQKMINMMYLVLTALLALNVSSEILNAFKTVNKSLETTNETVNHSTETILNSLEEKTKDSATSKRANIWYPKAKTAQELSKNLFTYIQTLKDRILVEAGGDPKDPTKKFKEDNLDVSTRIMVDKGEGQKLLKMLTDYRQQILAIDPQLDSAFKADLPITLEKPKSDTKAGKTWEGAYFHMVPTVAGLTILSKFQNDVKTSENRVIQFCHNKVGEVTVRYDTYAAFAQTNSSYVMPGDEMEITAGVGAFSKAALPSITIEGAAVGLGTDGAAHRNVRAAGSLGKHTVPVSITYTDVDGIKQVIQKNIEYVVGQASASIALNEMNVLYIGYDNKVSIAASGAGDDKVTAVISGGGGTLIKQGGGNYIAKVNSVTDDCIVTVNVDGKKAGQQVFRVRTIPQPVGTVGGYASGENIPAGAFKAQTGVGAYIKDFPLNLRYSVTSFTITADDPSSGDILEENCTGNLWNARAQTMVKNLSPGRMVTIDNLRAQGPDGRVQKLPSLVYYIK